MRSSGSVPYELESTALDRRHARREALAFATERPGQPVRVFLSCSLDPQSTYPGRRHPESHQPSRRRVERHEVEKTELAPIGVMTADRLVVAEKVSAAVQDEPAGMDLDALHVMGGVAVNDVDGPVLDEAAGADLVSSSRPRCKCRIKGRRSPAAEAFRGILWTPSKGGREDERPRPGALHARFGP